MGTSFEVVKKSQPYHIPYTAKLGMESKVVLEDSTMILPLSLMVFTACCMVKKVLFV